MTQFGRITQFDERSRSFPIRSLLHPAVKPRNHTWTCRPHLDQGQTSSCVGHGWAHEIAAVPVIDAVTEALALDIYQQAQTIDGFDGPHDGTSVLAGAKTVAKLGYMGEYRWAFGLDDLVLALGWAGPAVLGLAWHDGMMTPNSGMIRPTGPVVGGHCVLAVGVSPIDRMIRIHNSWGRTWGAGGDAMITFDDMATLLGEQGEACIPVHRHHPRPGAA